MFWFFVEPLQASATRFQISGHDVIKQLAEHVGMGIGTVVAVALSNPYETWFTPARQQGRRAPPGVPAGDHVLVARR
jgi:hypothetical protein